MSTEKVLNSRAQQVMKILVERYIHEGEPVASGTLAKESMLALSPASIRNVLAELEAEGYLTSPHTSAGRVPTEKGYRLFIDSLLTIRALDHEVIAACRKQLSPELDQHALLATATNMLSKLTRLVGVVTIHQRVPTVLKHIEFLALSNNQVLAVLVFSDKEVQNRIIYTERPYPLRELEQAANYLNQQYAGKTLKYIRRHLFSALKADRREIHGSMSEILHAMARTVHPKPSEKGDCLVSGKTNLVHLQKDTDMEHMRLLFEAFQKKHDILYLLDRCLDAEGVQIFVGAESGYAPLSHYSVISAPYASGERSVGVLGVIGPTRMSYDYVIPVVDVTAKLLSSALDDE